MDISWQEIFRKAIANFKDDQPIDSLLEMINSAPDDFDLNGRLDMAGIDFSCQSNFDFLIPIQEGIHNDYLFDYFDEDNEISIDDELEVLKEINNRIGRYLEGCPPHIGIRNHDGLILSAMCEILGQAGPRYSDFRIFKSLEDCSNKYIKEGWMISYDGGVRSHSDLQLIAIFKEYKLRNKTSKVY